MTLSEFIHKQLGSSNIINFQTPEGFLIIWDWAKHKDWWDFFVKTLYLENSFEEIKNMSCEMYVINIAKFLGWEESDECKQNLI